MEKQLQYIRQNDLFGVNDTLDEADWADHELVQSEIVNNVATVIQHNWIDKNHFAKNRILSNYLMETPAEEVLSGMKNVERYNDYNYLENIMMLANDIYESIDQISN